MVSPLERFHGSASKAPRAETAMGKSLNWLPHPYVTLGPFYGTSHRIRTLNQSNLDSILASKGTVADVHIAPQNRKKPRLLAPARLNSILSYAAFLPVLRFAHLAFWASAIRFLAAELIMRIGLAAPL